MSGRLGSEGAAGAAGAAGEARAGGEVRMRGMREEERHWVQDSWYKGWMDALGRTALPAHARLVIESVLDSDAIEVGTVGGEAMGWIASRRADGMVWWVYVRRDARRNFGAHGGGVGTEMLRHVGAARRVLTSTAPGRGLLRHVIGQLLPERPWTSLPARSAVGSRRT